jgi:hypothetical protein
MRVGPGFLERFPRPSSWATMRARGRVQISLLWISLLVSLAAPLLTFPPGRGPPGNTPPPPALFVLSGGPMLNTSRWSYLSDSPGPWGPGPSASFMLATLKQRPSNTKNTPFGGFKLRGSAVIMALGPRRAFLLSCTTSDPAGDSPYYDLWHKVWEVTFLSLFTNCS